MANKNEIVSFLKMVKGYYQEFSLNSNVLELWTKKLQDYDLIDIYDAFEEYLKGDFKNQPPKLHFLKKHLLTPKQKEELHHIKITCPNCGRTYSYFDITKHGARCSAIQYIKAREQLLDIHYNEDKLFEASDIAFEKLYDSFLKRIKPLVVRPDEKERLEHICEQATFLN